MFELIDQFLVPLGLQNPLLAVLQQDAALYNSLLFQPGENIDFGPDFIRIADRDRANGKFSAFFQLASERNVELAITPEYSCPWEVVYELLENETLPDEHHLWIIGCESIKARHLQDLMDNNPNIEWITEEQKIGQHINDEHFFNPVCYIFKTRTQATNQLRTVVIVQFKTQPLGGEALEWERDHFIAGERIYVLQNREESSRLITLICSDILNPQIVINQLPGFVNIPYLIVHIQLNQSPNNIQFSQYRGSTYGMGRANKEFICLNWSRNINLGQFQNWNQYGGSAIYMKPDQEKHLNVSDERINNNQSRGMYYTRWANRYANIYFLNFDEYVFLIRNAKPSQADAAPQIQRRSGPEMIEIFHWQENNWTPAIGVDSGFGNSCASLHHINNYANLLAMYADSCINTERLVCISAGKAIHSDWYQPKENVFFRVTDTEINERVTFSQNPCVDTEARRRTYLTNYGILEYVIIQHPGNFPDSISDLRGNCRISYRADVYAENFHLNLYPTNAHGVPATGAFIGISTPEDAEDLLLRMKDFFDDDHFGKRVVVWYYDHNGATQKVFDTGTPKISENTQQSTRSIRKGKKS